MLAANGQISEFLNFLSEISSKVAFAVKGLESSYNPYKKRFCQSSFKQKIEIHYTLTYQDCVQEQDCFTVSKHQIRFNGGFSIQIFINALYQFTN